MSTLTMTLLCWSFSAFDIYLIEFGSHGVTAEEVIQMQIVTCIDPFVNDSHIVCTVN